MLDLAALERCVEALKRAHGRLLQADPESVDYELFRAASIKEFELILEMVAKLLRRALRGYFTSTREIAELTYKNVFRYAARHVLLSPAEVDRWFMYRDNRNNTAHGYGKNIAEQTVTVLPAFIRDAEAMLIVLRRHL